MNQLEKFAKPILRIAMCLVFFYFGYQQITDPEQWVGYVPVAITSLMGITAKTLVLFNAVLELSFGTLMFIGLYTRFVALILSLHLFGIAFSLGFGELAVRDFGLAVATLSIFLGGKDQWCLDNKWSKNKPQ